MKKTTQKFLIAMFAIVTLGLTTASAQVYQKGDNLLNLGVGVGGGFGTPIGASYEYGFTEKISGGVIATYSSQDLMGYKITYLIAGARASYHHDFGIENLDTYAGVLLGYNKVSFDSGYVGSGSAVVYGGHVGARYYFTPKLGAFAEAGYGAANLTVGLALKF